MSLKDALNASPRTDGGAAFPKSSFSNGPSGMSLRDYFAGQAIIGFLPGHNVEGSYVDAFAKRAYQIADAMIRVRGQ